MSDFDFNFGPDIDKENADRDGRIRRRLVKVNSKAVPMLRIDENSPQFEAVEVLLGIKPGGNEKVAELLGLTVGTDATNGTPANNDELFADGRKWVKVYDGDKFVRAIPRADQATIDQYLANGFVPESRDGSNFLIKPKELATPIPDGYVEEVDSEGKHLGWISPQTAKDKGLILVGTNDKENRLAFGPAPAPKKSGWRS